MEGFVCDELNRFGLTLAVFLSFGGVSDWKMDGSEFTGVCTVCQVKRINQCIHFIM